LCIFPNKNTTPSSFSGAYLIPLYAIRSERSSVPIAESSVAMKEAIADLLQINTVQESEDVPAGLTA
jgi:hypothetical protein